MRKLLSNNVQASMQRCGEDRYGGSGPVFNWTNWQWECHRQHASDLNFGLNVSDQLTFTRARHLMTARCLLFTWWASFTFNIVIHHARLAISV